MKIIFMGTPDFAAVPLMRLIKEGYDVKAAVSQPDKPKGRGMRFEPTPVKRAAEEYSIPVLQPQSIKNGELKPLLEEVKPDIIFVAAYGKILPEYVLNAPKYGCVNAHASILPAYRGAAPIQRCIADGMKETGVTAMYMEKGLDTGNIILCEKVPIREDDTASSLHDRLAKLSGDVLIKVIRRFEEGDFSSVKQDETKASYAKMLTKADGEIDWTKGNGSVYDLIRGMYPWPMAYTYCDGQRFVPFDCTKLCGEGSPGEVIEVGKDFFTVACGEGALKIGSVKFDGKKIMSVHDYLLGHEIKEKVILGREKS